MIDDTISPLSFLVQKEMNSTKFSRDRNVQSFISAHIFA